MREALVVVARRRRRSRPRSRSRRRCIEVVGTFFSDTSVPRAEDPDFQKAVRALEQELEDFVTAQVLQLDRQDAVLNVLREYTKWFSPPAAAAGSSSSAADNF